ncbi:MAG: hypothetical protein L0206_04925, partial [Actinobacteria bacterium]|nr:hypothetical protein [Actinomycetota bacterium]
ATVSSDPLAVELVRRSPAALADRWDLRPAAYYMSALVPAPQPPEGIPELTDAYAPVEALQNF